MGMISETCCVCGRDVSHSSALFANRVPELNDYQTRIEMGRGYPHGDWVCIICDNTDSDGVLHDVEDVEFSIRHGQDILRVVEHHLVRRN